MCGSGLGAFIFNPFSKYLIDEYGWRGAILIEAAIILNCVLCGALFRPLKTAGKIDESEAKELLSKSIKDVIEMELLITNENGAANGVTANGQLSIGQGDIQPLTFSSSSRDFKVETEMNYGTPEPLFRSESALHRLQNSKNGTLPTSPLAVQQRPPHLRRLLSEEQPQHHRRHHIHHQLTPGNVFILIFYYMCICLV